MIFLPKIPFQGIGNPDQHAIACIMTVIIIEQFKMIHIHNQHTDLASAVEAVGFVKRGTVPDAGQCVMAGSIGKRFSFFHIVLQDIVVDARQMTHF